MYPRWAASPDCAPAGLLAGGHQRHADVAVFVGPMTAPSGRGAARVATGSRTPPTQAMNVFLLLVTTLMSSWKSAKVGRLARLPGLLSTFPGSDNHGQH